MEVSYIVFTPLKTQIFVGIKGSIRLHDLLEASDDEYGFVRTEVERALDCRDATEEEIMRESPVRFSYKVLK